MTFESTSDTIRASVSMNSDATVEMDIGASAGESDTIVIGFLTSDFNLGNSTLALVNEGGIVAGTYTLFQETLAGSDVNGTFGDVTHNGGILPEDWTLEYNNGSGIGTIDLVIVPEPSHIGILLGLGAMLLAWRHRK